jgi:hypothetical protein
MDTHGDAYDASYVYYTSTLSLAYTPNVDESGIVPYQEDTTVKVRSTLLKFIKDIQITERNRFHTGIS